MFKTFMFFLFGFVLKVRYGFTNSMSVLLNGQLFQDFNFIDDANIILILLMMLWWSIEWHWYQDNLGIFHV